MNISGVTFVVDASVLIGFAEKADWRCWFIATKRAWDKAWGAEEATVITEVNAISYLAVGVDECESVSRVAG